MLKGVLLINLGTPNSPKRGDVYTYLKQFLLDPRVIDYNWFLRNALVRGIIAPFRSGSSAKLYQRLWTDAGSPLKVYGEKVAEGVQKKLGEDYAVELAMRYQSPSIESAIARLKKKNVSEITVFPMFPQYASASTGSAHEEVMRVFSNEWVIPNLKFINSYYNDPRMIKLYADKARKYNLAEYDHYIFSFHGIPVRHLSKADHNSYCRVEKDCCHKICSKNQFCYSSQSYATAFAIANELGFSKDQYTISFQSRLGKEVWTQPYTSDVLEHLAEDGKKKILVFSPAFVSDCLETTVEILYEYKEEFLEAGGEQLDLVESLNDDPAWIDTIAEMVTAS